MKKTEYQDDFDGTVANSIDAGALFDDRQLVVVSNRQPYRHDSAFEDEPDEGDISRPIGGLTASLDPLMQDTGGTWIAWGDGDGDRDAVDGTDCVEVPPEAPTYTLRRLWLDDEQVDGYYYGFSNQVIWPLCHSSLATITAEQTFWEQYVQTNKQFASAIIDEVDERPVIWLHDYHLALAPWFIRRELWRRPIIMQFWHIPWPSWNVFRACPHREELLRGLLGNDLLGFHVDRYVQHFLECVDATLEDATINWRSGEVFYRGGLTRVEALPIGVPYEKIQATAAEFDREDYHDWLRAYGIAPETQIALGVDRLDYSKGIPERLRALEHLWSAFPEWRGKLTYLQKGTGSREGIDAYDQLQATVDAKIEQLNDRFGTADWQPVVRVEEYLSQRELYGLYRHVDCCLVSPVRDGLNLVAQEYAAAQLEGNGVLLLSEQAGAHDLFGDHAVSVSPFNVEDFAATVQEALTMPAAERRSRMTEIQQQVADHDLETWLQQHESMAQAVERARATHPE